MNNLLKSLKIDYWYKVFVVVGAAFLVTSLTIDLVGVDNTIVQLLSFGALLLGIGEWINHPLQTAIMPPTAYYAPGGAKITSYNRQPCLLGSLFDILGFIIAGIGVYKLF